MSIPAVFGSPEHWRERAEEARQVAEHILDEKAKQGMLAVAESYEKLAVRAEDRQTSKS